MVVGSRQRILNKSGKTHLLSHSRGRCLVMFEELLLPEGPRQSGYDSDIILSGPLWAKHIALWGDALRYV